LGALAGSFLSAAAFYLIPRIAAPLETQHEEEQAQRAEI